MSTRSGADSTSPSGTVEGDGAGNGAVDGTGDAAGDGTSARSGPASRLRAVRYGESAITALGEVVGAIKAQDPLEPVMVVVRDPLAGIAVRRRLAETGARGIAALDVVTLVELAERLGAPSLAAAGRRPLVPAVLLGAVAARLRTDPGVFAPVAEHPATAAALAQAVAALDRLGTSERAALDDLVASGSRVGTLPDVLAVADAVRAELTTAWSSDTDLLRATAAALRSGAAVLGAGHVVLHLPEPLDDARSALVSAFAEVAVVHVVLGLTGSSRADAPVVATVRAALPGLPERLEEPDPLHARTILHASDPDAEVHEVVRAVARDLETLPGHRIAVLYSSATPYARILHEQLAAAGIAVSGPGSRTAAERAAGRLLLGALDLVRRDVPRRATFEVLSGLPLRDAHGDVAPVPAWERISREAGVVRGQDWEVRLGAHETSQRERGDERGAHEARRTAALAATIGFLRDHVERAGRVTTWADAAAILRSLLETLLPVDRLGPPGDPDTRAEQAAHALTLSALDGLATLDVLGTSPTPASLAESLGVALAAASPRLGALGQGVHVGPLSSALGQAPQRVHILGASEDLLPGTPAEDALLPDEVRAVTEGALPTVRDRTARREREFLAALQLTPQVSVSFSRGDLRAHASRLPSRWLLPSLRALAGDDSLSASDYLKVDGLDHRASFASGLLSSAPVTEQEWRVRVLLAGGQLDDPVLQRARRAARGRIGSVATAYDGVIGALDGLSPFSRDRPLSATALESYASCPQSYFLRHVLGVREIEDPDDIEAISKLDRGSFLHECLDALITGLEASGQLPGFGDPWTPAHHAEVHRISAVVGEAYAARGVTGPERIWARSLVELDAQLDAMLDQDSAWRAEQGLAVLTSEARFGFGDDDAAPAVEIPLPDGTLRMAGAADMVDRAADGTLVVTDLKTGSAGTFQDISAENPVAGGTKLQLPTYARAVQARYGDPGTPVRARYWFPHEADKDIDLTVDASVDDAYRAALAVLTRGIAQGIFPRRPPTDDDRTWVRCSACNPDGGGYEEDRDRWEMLRTTPGVAALAALIDPRDPEPQDATATGAPATGDAR